MALLSFFAPGLVLAAALFGYANPGIRPASVLTAARIATLASLGLAVFAAIFVATAGAATSALIGLAGWGFSIRLDALSVTLFTLVSFIGVIVVQFSRNYLDGDDRQGLFFGHLCLTLAAVMLLVLSGNLVQLAFAWIATSLALRQLLLFYADRPAAISAARKHFVTGRIGDVFLIGAVFLLAAAFGTTDIATIQATAQIAEGASFTIILATFLIALAALAQSAQFPLHGWLPEVMETPTPVSALLHAGIINAGGFLVVRFADVMLMSAASLHLLALVGGFTALFGAVVMLTQTSIKVSLAWSTVAQMGFMILQCGLGVFALAILHIVAHSLYKAHAFLTSGSVVEIARASWVPEKARPSSLHMIIALAVALGLYIGLGTVFGVAQMDNPAVFILGAILIMGVTMLMAQGFAGKPNAYVIGRTAATAAGITIAYFLLQAGAKTLLASAVPPAQLPGVFSYAVMALVFASFGLVAVMQIIGSAQTRSPFWREVYVHTTNGFYFNAWLDRVNGTFKRPAADRS